MPKQTVIVPDAPPPGGPYSSAVVAGDFVYLAGAVPKLADGSWTGGTFAEQAHATFANLAACARAAGGDLSQAVRVGVYLADWADFAEMNSIYTEYFGTSNLPARTTLPVALHGFAIEVDAVLYLG